MEDQLQELLLRRSDNPHKDETCKCGRGLRIVRCHWDGCFQYPISCKSCYVDKHRQNPFHWALVWENGVWNKRDFSEVEPNNFIQLGHVDDETRCSGAGLPIPFIVTHTNGVHSTRISFCGCLTAPSSRVEQLLLSDLFPATPNEPKSAFTIAVLKQFRVHNLQSKCGAFDYIRSIRRFTDNTFTSKVPVGKLSFISYSYLTYFMCRIHTKAFSESLESGTCYR